MSPTEALEAALSIALLAEWEPRTFHDGKALRFAMARAIYALRDFWAGSQWDEETQKVKRVSVRKPGSLALNWLGERLQRKLGLWFANATTLIINEIDSQQQRARDLASLIPVSASN